MSHYFTNDDNLKDEQFEFEEIINGIKLSFKTGAGVFSKKRLDLGSKLLLESFDESAKSVLEIGVGYGPISIYLKKMYPNFNITGVDVNRNALEYARENAVRNKVKINFLESDFFTNVKTKFDLIVSNPPIRIGKEKLYDFYKKSIDYLNDNGVLLIVVAKDKGALSTITYLETIFPIVEKVLKKKGYVVIRAKKQ